MDSEKGENKAWQVNESPGRIIVLTAFWDYVIERST
jgi:hypothetical protein